jgi:hypothetical protein
MVMENRERIIADYIKGYNNFDIDRMVKDFDKDMIFENLSNGESTLVLNGVEAFREQATQSTSYFAERMQAVKSLIHLPDQTEVEIDYFAILAADLPNGMKKGEELKISGKSIFRFSGDKIIGLIDIS